MIFTVSGNGFLRYKIGIHNIADPLGKGSGMRDH